MRGSANSMLYRWRGKTYVLTELVDACSAAYPGANQSFSIDHMALRLPSGEELRFARVINAKGNSVIADQPSSTIKSAWPEKEKK